MTKLEVQSLIVQKANQYGVPPQIALGIAAHESGFNPNAVNSANPNGTKDWGVMQLNDTTVKTMGVSNPLDPEQNVDAGVRLLSSLLNRYNGDSTQALWAYASGPGNVGPSKTPNSIAQGFINYVEGYDASSIVGSGSPPLSDGSGTLDVASLVESINPFSGSGDTESAVVDWGLLTVLGIAGFALWLALRD